MSSTITVLVVVHVLLEVSACIYVSIYVFNTPVFTEPLIVMPALEGPPS